MKSATTGKRSEIRPLLHCSAILFVCCFSKTELLQKNEPFLVIPHSPNCALFLVIRVHQFFGRETLGNLVLGVVTRFFGSTKIVQHFSWSPVENGATIGFGPKSYPLKSISFRFDSEILILLNYKLLENVLPPQVYFSCVFGIFVCAVPLVHM